MKCNKCPYYERSTDYNRCKLLHFEYYREDNNCLVVNDDNSINEEEYEKAKEYMW